MGHVTFSFFFYFQNTSPEIDQCIPEENPETPSHLQSNPVVVQPQSSENQSK